jgi:WD40 repeat protein
MVAGEIPSLADKVRPVEAGGLVAAAAFLGAVPAFALGEGEVLLANGAERRVAVHSGAILEAACDGERLFTAGDDGRVVAIGADGMTETLVETPGQWIDHVALGPDGALAWSIGKSAFVRTKKADRSLDLPSSAGGLAFAPKGLRLAIAHYNGATLWFPNALEAKPEPLAWKGSHLGVLFSPDGRFLITSMQEPALHGWRLADGQHMRMTGYPARVRSMDFTSDGKWLATSGANEAILWPFDSKEGPTGKQPRTLAQHSARVAVVAGHPRQPVLAAGYADGLLLLIRLADGAAILARQPEGSAIGALAWRADGKALALGTEDGKAGVLTL